MRTETLVFSTFHFDNSVIFLRSLEKESLWLLKESEDIDFELLLSEYFMYWNKYLGVDRCWIQSVIHVALSRSSNLKRNTTIATHYGMKMHTDLILTSLYINLFYRSSSCLQEFIGSFFDRWLCEMKTSDTK